MTGIFNTAFEKTMGHEGELSEHRNDIGGLTKYGISSRAYPYIDIQNLTLYNAKKIYWVDYFDTERFKMDALSEKLAIECFDTAVNMGVETSAMMLQDALNLLNRVETKYDDLVVDGIIGQKSYLAIKAVNESRLIVVLNGLQFERYHKIVTNNHSQEIFFAGWMNRVSL